VNLISKGGRDLGELDLEVRFEAVSHLDFPEPYRNFSGLLQGAPDRAKHHGFLLIVLQMAALVTVDVVGFSHSGVSRPSVSLLSGESRIAGSKDSARSRFDDEEVHERRACDQNESQIIRRHLLFVNSHVLFPLRDDQPYMVFASDYDTTIEAAPMQCPDPKVSRCLLGDQGESVPGAPTCMLGLCGYKLASQPINLPVRSINLPLEQTPWHRLDRYATYGIIVVRLG